MPASTTMTTTPSSPPSRPSTMEFMRTEIRNDIAKENWASYSVSTMIKSVRNLATKAEQYSDAGDWVEAYKLYYKAAEVFQRVLSHKEFTESQRHKSETYHQVQSFQSFVTDHVVKPAKVASTMVKEMELSKAQRRDTPIMPGTSLPFTLPPTPPASTASAPSWSAAPLSPTSQEPRTLADRMSMLREHGLQDVIQDGQSSAGPTLNGKRFSRESIKSVGTHSSSPSISRLSPHSTALNDTPSLLPSPPIAPASSRPPSRTKSPSPEPIDLSGRETHVPSPSEFIAAFPSVSQFEAELPTFPSVPAELPSLPAVPSSRPGGGTQASHSGALPSRASGFASPSPPSLSPSNSGVGRSRSPPRISPKPASLKTSSLGAAGPPSSYGASRPSSVASVPTHRSGGRSAIPSSISPKELLDYLEHNMYAVLLLDVREQQQHRSCHIAVPQHSQSASVQLEPSILNRPSLTSASLEDALVLNAAEQYIFMRRAEYAVVVMYDDSTTNLGQSEAMKKLVRVIWENEFAERKKLDKPPIVLVGGLKAWKTEFGEKGLEGDDVIKARGSGGKLDPVVINGVADDGRLPPIDERRPISTPHRERVETLREERGRSSLDQLPNRIWTPPSPSAETPDARLQRKRAISRSQGSTRLNSLSRDGQENLPPSPYPMSPTSTSPTTTSNMYPTLNPTFYNHPSGATSASGLSAYRSAAPLLDTYLPAPPQASAPPTTYMSRRRSDYTEHEQYSYSGAPPASRSIDYPHLNVNAAPIITPPPAVASSSLQRQDVRQPPPRPGSQYTQGPGHQPPEPASYPDDMANGTVIKRMMTPPRIPSDWPVQYWGDQALSTSGLKNLGNTCYMNAPIQCLSATIPFARFFLEHRWERAVNTINPLGTKGQLARAFATLLHQMWQASYSYLSPVEFRRDVCTYNREFSGSDQHDAQEFISILLDRLHEDLNRILQRPPAQDPTPEREAELESLPQQIAGEQEWELYSSRNDSIVVDYFQGQFRNRMQCMTCHKTSTTYNTFMYLSLPIPTGRGMSKVTLQQCLDAFVKEEVMEKDDAWYCPNCKVLRRATKRLSISRLPPVLLIHLKRFSVKGPFTDKLETLVDFPLKNLDLTNYMPPPLPLGSDKGQLTTAPIRLDDPRAQVPPYRYDLYAVTNHFGSLSNGHYTAFIASKGAWVNCDDSRISNADPSSVVAKPAYILFYKRVPR